MAPTAPSSPQDMSECDDEDNTPLGNIFYSKDKQKRVMKWNKCPLDPSNIRKRASNIVLRLPGPRGEARNTKTEIDCFNLYFDDDVIEMIVNGTNIYISGIKDQFERERDARPTDKTEIRAFIGILSGCLGSGRKHTKHIWDNNRGSGVESCYLTMSENRFHFLMRCMRFDDIRDRPQRKAVDNLAHIRSFFELIVQKFKTFFTPSEYCTVDEHLLKFRGNCQFKIYIPSKPGKYGIKVFALVCAKTMYVYNLEVYVAKQPPGPFNVSQSAEDVTIRICELIAGTNRNITMDNWFTSIPLAEKLFEEKQLTIVGTMRSNRIGIPEDLKANKNRELYSSIFAHHKKKTLVSYCPKKNKAVVLLSTMHSDQTIDLDSGELKKPEIVTFYNRTKVGVDVVDQMCVTKYDESKNTKRWPMVIFFGLVNNAAINASRIYKFNNMDTSVPRREFLDHLAWELIHPQIRKRLESSVLPTEMKIRARRILGIEEPRRQPIPQDNRVGRCYLCGRARDKSTRKCCDKCGYKICPDHSSLVCHSCLNSE
ncbi:piggyBac transposable element-derived protein 4-like [Homalodisca vitripennis]|uniref:piggyBac transposable element-derived protein 4-like n=1 Tax=Homalodisca vitripennis TaxID=197043 RepID=UPI001EEA7F35|nr:piggyBac transposable element-derived protein 4-like [Homalodisca vitripennis]